MRPTLQLFVEQGEVRYIEPSPKSLDVSATQAKQVARTKEISDTVALAYAHAAEMVAGLREREKEFAGTSMAVKRDGCRLMYWGDAGTPIGLYVDPLSGKIPEAKAGRGFLIEVLKAERKGRKC